MNMKCLAIGDVHGCLTALKTLIDFVQPNPDDTIVMLGDYVDRGPDSRGVIDWLITESDRRNLVCLRGNHEIMMMDALGGLALKRRWATHGGIETFDSYDDESDDLETAVSESHWEFLKGLLPYYETDTHIFVHAAALGDIPMSEQGDYMLFWERFGSITPHDGGKTFVCGHTRQQSGLPTRNAHAICIDTNACRGGWLTCLDVESGRYYQANQDAETRSGWLDEVDCD